VSDLLERDLHRAALRDLCTRTAEDGEGGALVLSGRAGTGRSALLEVARAEARAAGLIVLDALPEQPLNHDGPPALVCVDDADRLDDAAARLLGFVGRRLARVPVALVIARAAHVPSAHLAGLPEVDVEPLSDDAARTLLARRTPLPGDDAREELLAVSAGRPLALTQLCAADSLLTPALAHAFRDPIAALPDRTRALLLAAALEPDGGPAELLQAAGAIAGAQAGFIDLEPAIAAGVAIEAERLLRFEHPLTRAAALELGCERHRGAAHAALAEVMREPGLAVLHRAHAAAAPDPSLADALERTAHRLAAQGRVERALEAFGAAARHAPGDTRRGAVLEHAADLAMQSRHRRCGPQLLARCAAALERAGDAPGAALARARLAVLTETSGAGLAALLATIPCVAATHGPELALRALRDAAAGCWGADEATRAALFDTALAIGDPALRAGVTGILAVLATPEQLAIVAARVADGPRLPVHPDAQWLLAVAAFHVGEDELCLELTGRLLRRAAARGLDAARAVILITRAMTLAEVGHWDQVEQSAGEAARLARQTAQTPVECEAYALLAFLAGAAADDDARHAGLRAEAERLARSFGSARHLMMIRTGSAIAAAVAGRYDEALALFTPLYTDVRTGRNAGLAARAAGFFAAAAVKSGHPEPARAALATLHARLAGVPRHRRMIEFSRPMLTAPDEAEHVFQEVLAGEQCAPPYHQARMRFAYGTWLRGRRRIVDSRPQLRMARDLFVRIGNEPFAARARRELRAAGEGGGGGETEGDAWRELDPQDAEIARLAAEGLTNREIGERLHLSPRTVGSYLYRIFPKLGVTSRSQLAGVVPTALGEEVA
jgi:DNA-binding CsgD family transcriptional regulator